MCSVSSLLVDAELELALATSSSTNCAATASRTRRSRSASNSSWVWPSSSRYLLQRHAGVGELLLDAARGARSSSSATIDLGQRDLDQVEQLLEDGVARGGGLLEALAVAEPGADVVGQLVGGVELRGELGELVVELGQLLLLDLRDLDLDLDVLADAGRRRPAGR